LICMAGACRTPAVVAGGYRELYKCKMLYSNIAMTHSYIAAMMPQLRHVRRKLKLRQLEIVLAVADARSMAKAAKQLAISQPAISRAIADAEQALGLPLFDRSRQGVRPTHYADALIKRGIAAFDEIAQGEKDAAFLADPASGELWIASAPGLAEGIVLTVVNRLSRKYPRVTFHIVPSFFGVHELLRDRRVELGFGRTNARATEPNLNTEILFEDSLAVVAGVQNPLLRRRKIRLADLVQEPWTWPARGTEIDILIGDAFRASGAEPPIATVYADSINMRVRLAATGPYLAIVPASIMRFPGVHPGIKVLPVQFPTTRRPIAILSLKNRTLSPLAQLFIACARDIIKDSRPVGSDRSA
jgi:DNA-binding transcriptional LysR family regulator